MFAKLQISGELLIETGLHIGGSSAFSAIGAVDSPIIKDSITKEPMIPGSSFKGKLRTLLAKKYSEDPSHLPTHNEDVTVIKKLFGSSDGNVTGSQLLFSDMFLINKSELKSKAENVTEVKFENSIDRKRAIANPRQIERAIRGSKFAIDIIYEVLNNSEVNEDMQVLAEGLKLLRYDYLGGNGSRGYGKVQFSNLECKCVVGEIDDSTINACNEILANVAE